MEDRAIGVLVAFPSDRAVWLADHAQAGPWRSMTIAASPSTVSLAGIGFAGYTCAVHVDGKRVFADLARMSRGVLTAAAGLSS